MAIDSRDKRASCLGTGTLFRVVYPNPDGGIDTEAERIQTVGLYAGLAAGPPTPETPTGLKDITLQGYSVVRFRGVASSRRRCG